MPFGLYYPLKLRISQKGIDIIEKKCYIVVGKRKATQIDKKKKQTEQKTIDYSKEAFIMNNNTLYFEGFDEFNADLTLDNVNPWLLIATYTNAYAA